jgi:plastocyanin
LFSAGGSRSKRTRLVAGIFGVALVLAACGGDDNGGEPTGPGATTEETGATGATGGNGGGGGGGGDEIIISGFAFQPSTIEVSGPTEFTIVNEDSVAHTFTLDDGSIDETLAGGGSVTVTIDVSESQGFVCRFHPGMEGTVEVV